MIAPSIGPVVDVRRALLSAYAVCCGIVVILVALAPPANWIEAGSALAIQAAVGVLLMIDRRLTGAWQMPIGVFAVVAYLISVGLLREGSAQTTGFGALALLPVTWTSLRGRRAEFLVAVVGLALVLMIPAVVIGPPRYPAGSWRSGVLMAVIAAALGGLKLELVHKLDGLVGRLEALARTDDLTGLPNRRVWREELDRALAGAQRTGRSFVVVLIDLDGFKAYNDTHGHLAADRLLRHLAAGWTGVLRDTDVLARWGGDEFGVLLTGCDEDHAFDVLDRMRAVCPETAFSAGIARPHAGEGAGDVLARADAALYSAKAARAERHPPLATASQLVRA